MHYYKRNIGDYSKKAGRLSMLQHGSYTLLIDACYDREKFPTLEEAIEWTWASSSAEIEAVEFVLKKFFKLIDGVYVQPRIEEEIAEYHSKAETNKRIAMQREANRRASSTSRAQDVHEPPPNHKPLTTNQEPETKNQKPKAEGEKRGSRLPDDWHPTEADTAFCKANRPDLKPSEVARRFYDYWIAVPGAKGRKLDWSATWRNWVSNEKGASSAAPPQQSEKFHLGGVDRSGDARAMAESMRKHNIASPAPDDPINF